MNFSYDKEHDAAYLRLIDGHTAVNSIVVNDEKFWKPIVVDLDSEGHVVGFEFLDATEILPPDFSGEFR